jgi:glycosyltransferase involved in cell wall biosynthesis
MRILFFIKSLTLPGGGAEKVMSEVASALSERGHEVTAASFDRLGTPDFYSFDARVKRARLSIGDVSASSGAMAFVRSIRSLRKLMIQNNPDVAVGFMHSAFVPLALSAAWTKVPLVASEHTPVEHYRSRPLQFRLARWCARRFAAMTIPSERARNAFPADLRSRMVVIPNAVSAKRSRQQVDAAGGPRVLAVGGLREEKGHAVLLAAFSRIAPAFPNWTLRLVGEGACRAALERQVVELGLWKQVNLAGAVADVGTEYEAAEILAVPSTYESFGLATADGLAHGLPALGFADCPGTNELIVDGVNGLLVSGEDRAAALAQGLAKLMNDPALRRRLGAAGPASVERYSPGSVFDRWEELLRATAAQSDRLQAASTCA